jgi:hypothetical protein
MSQQTNDALLSRTSHDLRTIFDSLNAALIGPLVDGGIPMTTVNPPAGMTAVRRDQTVRDLWVRFRKFADSAAEFPGYCDVGTEYFRTIYDWHVRHRQPIVITRDAENRMMIQFMFTQLVLRPEMEEYYCGQPYDK